MSKKEEINKIKHMHTQTSFVTLTAPLSSMTMASRPSATLCERFSIFDKKKAISPCHENLWTPLFYNTSHIYEKRREFFRSKKKEKKRRFPYGTRAHCKVNKLVYIYNMNTWKNNIYIARRPVIYLNIAFTKQFRFGCRLCVMAHWNSLCARITKKRRNQ